jgi:hypothetical protein
MPDSFPCGRGTPDSLKPDTLKYIPVIHWYSKDSVQGISGDKGWDQVKHVIHEAINIYRMNA